MNAQQRNLVFAAALGVVLVAVVVYQMTRKPPPPPGTTQAGSAAPHAQGATPNTPAAPAPAGPGTAAAPPQAGGADVDLDTLLASIREVDFDYEMERVSRDPMTPLVGGVPSLKTEPSASEATPVALATLGRVMNKKVSGIVWDAKKPVAIVDNEVVYPGFVYDDGTRVDSIQRNSVVFKVGDSLIEVELKEL